MLPARKQSSSVCTAQPWTPRLEIQLGGLDPDPPCAPHLHKGSSGVGSEELKTWGFHAPGEANALYAGANFWTRPWSTDAPRRHEPLPQFL